MFRCDVDRERGDSDTVTLTWEIHPIGGEDNLTWILAEDDFVNATGKVIFEPGERQKVLDALKFLFQEHPGP